MVWNTGEAGFSVELDDTGHDRAGAGAVIAQLLSGVVSRERASFWAARGLDENRDDEFLDEALEALALVDVQHGERVGDYLFDLDELDWLNARLNRR